MPETPNGPLIPGTANLATLDVSLSKIVQQVDNLDMSNKRITDLATPIDDLDAVNKAYVDGSSGSPDGPDTSVQFNDSGAFGGSKNFVFDGSAMGLSRTGTTNVVNIQASTSTTNYTLTLPVDDGSPNEFLQTNGSGILSWTTVSGGSGSPGAPDFSLQFNDGAGSFAGSSKLTYDDAFETIIFGSEGGTAVLQGKSSSGATRGGSFIIEGGASESGIGGTMEIIGGTSESGIGGRLTLRGGPNDDYSGGEITFEGASEVGGTDNGGLLIRTLASGGGSVGAVKIQIGTVTYTWPTSNGSNGDSLKIISGGGTSTVLLGWAP